MSITESNFFYIVLSLTAYFFGVQIQKKLKWPIFNPLLISAAIIIPVLLLLGTDFETYRRKAGLLSEFLTPATVCLALPLYQHRELLKKNFKAIILGVLAGAAANGISIFLMCLLLNLGHQNYVTLLPKSITLAIALGAAEILGASTALTVISINIAGIIGNSAAEKLCGMFGLTNPIAKGIAIGSCSHAMGTAKAMEMGPLEGTASSLALVLTGLLTIITVQFFALLI